LFSNPKQEFLTRKVLYDFVISTVGGDGKPSTASEWIGDGFEKCWERLDGEIKIRDFSRLFGGLIRDFYGPIEKEKGT
jgi:hypothetical protein